MVSQEYYLRNLQGDEFYATNIIFQEFAIELKDESMELKGEVRVEYYARDISDQQYYAKNTKGDEQYARDESGNPYYVYDGLSNQRYAIADGKEVYAMNSGYAKNVNGKEIYAKEDGHEYMFSNNYAKDENGEEYYPKNSQGWERVFGVNENIVYARDLERNEKYPRDPNLVEYYPHPDKFPRKRNGSLFYATTSDFKIIFPRSKYGEEYIYDEGGACLTGVTRYAMNQANCEKYPMKLQIEIILNNHYAVDEKGHPMYPLDEWGNEYLQKKDEKYDVVLTLGYPISQDGFIIVPGNALGPQIDDTLSPKIKRAEIIRLLPKNPNISFIGYLTNVKSKRKPRILSGYLFKRDVTKVKNKNYYKYYIFIPFFLAILAFIFFYLV